MGTRAAATGLVASPPSSLSCYHGARAISKPGRARFWLGGRHRWTDTDTHGPSRPRGGWSRRPARESGVWNLGFGIWFLFGICGLRCGSYPGQPAGRDGPPTGQRVTLCGRSGFSACSALKKADGGALRKEKGRATVGRPPLWAVRRGPVTSSFGACARASGGRRRGAGKWSAPGQRRTSRGRSPGGRRRSRPSGAGCTRCRGRTRSDGRGPR